ncbi:unnamed protein product [Didymodactylos carnosus]|uniref:Rab-GAP TBC domain-containing protein n=1 Tax=Didymodactylos carnosus TaxID=1234261 RepID=A0A8S2IDN4_9BILA|nr:unnamed protein product [Didymodactylos carnosus]CAF3735703.1 unnamed protein product [Didymodactylos carnosus]
MSQKGKAQTKNSQQDASYEVISLESKSEMERKVKLQAAMRNQQNGGTSSDDEPIASGFGVVSKECSEDILDNWSDILLKWRKNYSERPRGLQTLVRKGVPEALRGEVWQLLAGSTGKEFEMIDTYRLLLTKESASERVILNDLNRTFPAHEYFKEVGGIGQEALYKLSRAYSVRDEEVGYCQGLSFVIATLLIHMPEEQAFMLLCKMMEDPRYDLREMYKASFENLQMRFHQLHCLMRDNLPELYDHFDDLKLLCHMYASQWFLTLFTAKFPLYLVFRIMDLFLYEVRFDGFNSLFAVGLALLKCAQKDLLVLDFEGVMRYFRVSLPKKYRCEDHADELIQTACSMKISPKKLKRYEKEHYELKALEEQGDEPLNRLECDNKRLQGTCIRLELENEMLALELVNDRVKLKEKIDKSDDRIETLARELTATRTIVRESELHTIRINEELENIKEAFRQTCNELQQTQKIVTDYKQICSQLNDQLEIQSNMYKGKLEIIQDRLSNCCDSCKLVLMPDTGDNISLGTTPLLSSSPKQHTFYNSTITNTPDYSNFAADYELKVRQVENELAEKKLQLTQALCENQELLHQLRTVTEQKCLDYNNIPTTSADFIRQSQQGNSSTNSWLSKTVNTIKEATRSSSGSIKFS